MNQKKLVKHYTKNPILTVKDSPYPVETVHNSAVVKHTTIYIR